MNIIETEMSPTGYYKIRIENRERFLLTESEYNSLFNEGLYNYESTSGNFYNTTITNNNIVFIQVQ